MDFVKKYYGTAIYLIGGLLALIIISKIGGIATADSLEAEESLSDSTAALGVSFVLPLMWIAGLSTLGFSIYKIVTNREALIRFGIGIGSLLVIWFIAYGTSTDDVTTLSTKVSFTPSELKFVGGIVKTLIILMIVGGGLAIAAEVKKALKNG